MIKLNVKEMMCGGCAKSVTEAIKAVDADADVSVELENGSVSVASSAAPDAIRNAIEEAGFPAELA
ncbi:heavy-metal-associated domain-containing protein [uncultured Cohaesibacter sp.]|uniref:heavy-metal-associated domain-containing protein n=1 Tax=uncultured Cohaesibacter sp. TaxID=1002546 RepID=UPI0029311EFD|nr:heavy-metal-associated domain-containing protein [uncultured Cohaesibacter sp.]